jgi:hypothetical protein
MESWASEDASCQRDADAYVTTLTPLPNWARVLARVSLSLTEYPLLVRFPAGSRFAPTRHSQQLLR